MTEPRSTGDSCPAQPEPEVQQLASAPVGVALSVEAVTAAEAHAVRLKRMGICVGRHLLILSAGNPMILRVVGTRIALSRHLAEQVSVARLEPCPVNDAMEDTLR